MDDLTNERYPGHQFDYAVERWLMPTPIPDSAPVTAAVSRRRRDLLVALPKEERHAAA